MLRLTKNSFPQETMQVPSSLWSVLSLDMASVMAAGEQAPSYIMWIVEQSVQLIEAAGIGIVLLGVTVATFFFFWQLLGATFHHAYLTYRQNLGRSIVVGLEFFIAADIIKTVVIEPTFKSVGVLGAIVLVRTFLSFTLELEINKRWPWQEVPPSEAEKI